MQFESLNPLRFTFLSIGLIGVISVGLLVPPANGQDPQLEPNLVICGGGALPDDVFRRFRELAGEEAVLVVIPTASAAELDRDQVVQLWKSRGFEQVSILHTADRKESSLSSFSEPLREATAVWFSGGSQQRIADAYLGTPLEDELQRLLARGGVIGGTSAGAAIQSRVMIAGGRKEPVISRGLDLLEGAIIDQHFLHRNRVPRLLKAIRERPHLVGFGIDEGTALVVHRGKANVVGNSYVLRIVVAEGTPRVDAYHQGNEVPLPKG